MVRILGKTRWRRCYTIRYYDVINNGDPTEWGPGPTGLTAGMVLNPEGPQSHSCFTWIPISNITERYRPPPLLFISLDPKCRGAGMFLKFKRIHSFLYFPSSYCNDHRLKGTHHLPLIWLPPDPLTPPVV